MAFTRQFYYPASGPSLHWIALPWRYQPQDVGTIGQLDTRDLCQDLGGASTIAAIVRWDNATSTLIEHSCGGSPFPLTEGTAYALRNASGQTILGALVGAHDDAFTYSIPASGGSQLSWLSIPGHVRIPEKHGDPRVTAEDLCRQIGNSEVLAIVRFEEASGLYRAYGCGSAFETPFDIVRGEAYAVVNRPGQAIVWQPLHY
jgi:hypothetical protein